MNPTPVEPQANEASLLAKCMWTYGRCWKSLLLAALAYRLLAFVVLFPLLGLLFRLALALSGREVLADEEVLHYFLGPAGWLCFVLVGSVWVVILAAEQSALLAIVAAGESGERVRSFDALRFALSHGMPVLRVAIRMMLLVLVTALPFLIAAGIVYLTLLTRYDINFYLKEKPPVFWLAAGLGGVIGCGLLGILLRYASNWLFALPLVLFEKIAPRDALGISRQRVHGQRRRVLVWLMLWFLTTTVIAALATGAVVWSVQAMLPASARTMWLMVIAVGVTVAVMWLVNLATSLLSTTTFATMLYVLYRRLGGAAEIAGAAGLQGMQKIQLPFKVTRTRLVLTALLGLVLAGVVGAATMLSVPLEDNTAVTAHRGASGSAPEGTIAAIEKAIADGADWVEIDVQEIANGEVVVFHDMDFKRIAGNRLKIWDATPDDLAEIDIGSWFGPEFKGQHVPTLREVLAVCKGKIGVLIELKYYGHDQKLEQRVADIVEAEAMEAEIMIMSLKYQAVEKMKALRPTWKVGLLTSVAVGNLTRRQADFLAVNQSLATREFVQAAHREGIAVFAWTVNNPRAMSELTGRGVDNLITDHPELARAALRERAELSPPERFLLEIGEWIGIE